jgi:hypothetical protein
MKTMILVFALVISTLTFAQGKREKGQKLSAEQQTELQVKKMTLELDLDANQQKEVKTILIAQAKNRTAKMAEMKAKKEKGVPPTADEKFATKNQMLDHQIAHKAQMKKILKPEQFQKWEENQENRQEKMAEKAEKRKADRTNQK